MRLTRRSATSAHIRRPADCVRFPAPRSAGRSSRVGRIVTRLRHDTDARLDLSAALNQVTAPRLPIARGRWPVGAPSPDTGGTGLAFAAGGRPTYEIYG